MPYLRNLILLCASLSLSSSTPISPASLLCPSFANFRLEAQAVQRYLAPDYPCEPGQGFPCYAFFVDGNTSDFVYTIEAGTTNLKIVSTPPGGPEYVAGFYLDVLPPIYTPNPVAVSPDIPSALKCTVVPDLTDLGTCNLDCEVQSNGQTVNQLAIDPNDSNEFYVGGYSYFVNTIVKVRY